MPVCGRLEEVTMTEHAGGLRFSAMPHREATKPVDFATVLARLLPGWEIGEKADGSVVGNAPPSWDDATRVGAETILYLLETSVTIDDQADASHALRIHRAFDESTGESVRSDIGKLVRTAKSYDQSGSPGDRRAAIRLANEMLYWIEEIPCYREADVIVSAPPTNPNKDYDLPAFIAERVESSTSMQLSAILSEHTEPQKGLPEDEKASAEELAQRYSLTDDINGKIVLVIDDIYESGATVGGITHVLRAGGARAVLSLTATKTAKGCQGLPPHIANWPLEV